MTNIPPRPKDPELAELHDLAVKIQERNRNRRDMTNAAWVCYALGFIATFIPRVEPAGWAILGLGMLILLFAMFIYDPPTQKLRHELYEKGAKQARQKALQLIDRVKAALPEKNVSIAHDGNIVLQDKPEAKEAK